MNKKLKWTIIAAFAVAVGVFGYYQLTPHENEELAGTNIMPQNNKKTLSVI